MANKKTQEYKLVEVEFMPNIMEDGKLYYSKEYDICCHLCACGCGEKVFTPTGEGGWKFDKNTTTLSPSIGSFQIPCKSHYFIRNGKVAWC